MGNQNLISEFASFILRRKKWWLLPVLIALLIGGALIIFGQSSTLSPFIYALF